MPFSTLSSVMQNVNNDWFFTLLFNIYGYLTILFPVGIIVYLVKHDYCFKSFSTFPLINVLVFGKVTHPSEDIERFRSIEEEPLCKQGNDEKITSPPSNMRRRFSLLFCFLGLHSSYLIWGIFQEKIMTTNYKVFKFVPDERFPIAETPSPNVSSIKFTDSQFLVLVSRILSFTVGSVIFFISLTKNFSNSSNSSNLFRENGHLFPERTIAPLYKFFFCSLSNILSSWCQYEALKFVNFPTQVLSKACKIPSVMLMSKLVSGKKYAIYEYICALFTSLGMALFLYGNHLANDTPDSLDSTDQNFSNLINGVIVLVLYLVFDSFTSNWEEKISHNYKISPWQMMAGVNFCSISLTLTSLTEQGNLIPAIEIVLSSYELAFDCIILSISSTFGQFFVFYTISSFGALVFAMIMTLRQIFAILLSFLIYGHKISIISIISIIIVFKSILTLRLAKIKR